jgi:hypothetical protein
MNGRRSRTDDRPIVAMKRANEVARAAEESVSRNWGQLTEEQASHLAHFSP